MGRVGMFILLCCSQIQNSHPVSSKETRVLWVEMLGCVLIITDKGKLVGVGEEVKGVGVMKDEEFKLEEIEASHKPSHRLGG